MISPYQNLLDEIVRALQLHHDHADEHIDEETIIRKMQICEYEICIVNDWNFSMASGAEILFLKMKKDENYEKGLFD